MNADNAANPTPVDSTGVFPLVDPVPPVTYDARTVSTVAAVEGLDAERESVLSELTGEIESRVLQLEADRDLTIAELTGQTSRMLETHEDELAKAAQKVYGSATADMDRIYQTMTDGGIAVPLMSSEVANDLANPEPYQWVMDRLNGTQTTYDKPISTDIDDTPPLVIIPIPPVNQSPPYVPLPPSGDWPPPSIFDPPIVKIPSGQNIINVGSCANTFEYPSGWVGCHEIDVTNFPAGPPVGFGWVVCTDANSERPRVLQCQITRPVPTTPPVPPTTTVPPVTGACPPVCVNQSYTATISFGPACTVSSPLPTSPGGATSPPSVPHTPPTAPPPPPPTEPVGGDLAPLPASEWDEPDVCDKLSARVLENVPNPGSVTGDVYDWLIGATTGGDPLIWQPDWLTKRVEGSDLQIIDKALESLFKKGTSAITDVLNGMEKDGWPVNHVIWSCMGVLTTAGFAQQWFGAPLDYVTTPIRNYMQYAFPVNIPTQSDLDKMFLQDRITSGYWECLTRANGNLPKLHTIARDGQQERTNIQDLIELFYRKSLTFDELVIECRKRGVLDLNEVNRWVELHYSYPTLPDIMRMMVREVQVEASVIQDQLALGFAEAYTGKLKEWGEIAGIPEQVAYYEWLAHWVEISPTQAYMMAQRLRPGRNPNGVTFDRKRLERTLKEADYPPGLIPQLIEISYNPVTRTDAIKGYYAGTIDEKELNERFQDVGYSPSDATLLVQILHDDRERRTVNQGGQWTPRKILKEYRDSIISHRVADDLLKVYYKSEDLRNQQLDAALQIQTAEIKRKCMGGVRRRFLIGEYDDKQAKDKLLLMDFENIEADTLIERWNCEKYTRRKEPTVKFLQEWYFDGLIPYNELLRRLMNLGYEDMDAIRIAQHTFLDLEKKQAKQLEEEKRKAEQEANKNKPKPAKAGKKPKA